MHAAKARLAQQSLGLLFPESQRVAAHCRLSALFPRGGLGVTEHEPLSPVHPQNGHRVRLAQHQLPVRDLEVEGAAQTRGGSTSARALACCRHAEGRQPETDVTECNNDAHSLTSQQNQVCVCVCVCLCVLGPLSLVRVREDETFFCCR